MSDSSTVASRGRELLRRLRVVDAETLLDFFTERQYVKPRASVWELLLDAEQRFGVCPAVSRRALTWLELEESRSVGRLRRTELMQLARCLHRFLRHTGVGQCGRARPRGSSVGIEARRDETATVQRGRRRATWLGDSAAPANGADRQ